MIAKFRYHSEKMCIAKISQGLRNFRYGCKIFAILAKFLQCIAKILHTLALPLHCLLYPFQLLSFQFFLTSLHPGLMKSLRILNIWHRYETKLEIMTEARKTCKITKNKLETKSVVLSGPAHVNWLNSPN